MIELKVGKSFSDSEAWKEAHALVLFVFKTTGAFYKHADRVKIADEIRMAALGVSSHIAEGFVQEEYKQKVRYYTMAEVALTRLENLVLAAGDLEYLYARDFEEMTKQWQKARKIIHDLLGKSEVKKKA